MGVEEEALAVVFEHAGGVHEFVGAETALYRHSAAGFAVEGVEEEGEFVAVVLAAPGDFGDAEFHGFDEGGDEGAGDHGIADGSVGFRLGSAGGEGEQEQQGWFHADLISVHRRSRRRCASGVTVVNHSARAMISGGG